MAIKHILIDLDDTVYDFHRAEKISISKTLAEFGVEPTEAVVKRYSVINSECWRMLEKGVMTREQILVERFKRLFDELGVGVNADEARRKYETNLSECAYTVEGAMELIHALRGEGKYTVSIASNGTARVQDKRIAKGGIAPLFDRIFISERTGAAKPSLKFFDKCLEVLGAKDRREVIIIGDSLSSDIAGGIAAGIWTCHFNPKGKITVGEIKPDFSVSRLSDVLTVLDIINEKRNSSSPKGN